MASTHKDHEVPGLFVLGDLEEMKELLKSAGLLKASLYDLSPDFLRSGSKVTQKQFASFLIIFPQMLDISDLEEKELGRYGLERSWQKAGEILNDFEDFSKYLELIDRKKPIQGISRSDSAFPSSLRTLLDFQQLAIPQEPSDKSRMSSDQPISKRTPRSRRSSFEERHTTDMEVEPKEEKNDAKDSDLDIKLEVKTESTVNAAIIVFLREFSSLVDNGKVEFVFDQILMKADFKNNASFTCITDGVCQRVQSKDILATVEAKKRDRNNQRDRILMQEAAKLVCWLKTHPIHPVFLKGHPLVISQNRETVYLSFASLNQDYLDYLKVASYKPSPDVHASVQTYGPFLTSIKDDMALLARLVVAITLEAKNY